MSATYYRPHIVNITTSMHQKPETVSECHRSLHSMPIKCNLPSLHLILQKYIENKRKFTVCTKKEKQPSQNSSVCVISTSLQYKCNTESKLHRPMNTFESHRKIVTNTAHTPSLIDISYLTIDNRKSYKQSQHYRSLHAYMARYVIRTKRSLSNIVNSSACKK